MTDSTVRAPIKNFRTLSGLGDAVYSAPIVAHFAKTQSVYVSTHYPEVFQFIPNIFTQKEPRPNATTLRYSRNAGHTFYGDICAAAGVPMLPFSLPWQNSDDMEYVFSKSDKRLIDGRLICLIKEPSPAHMDRNRGDFRMTPDFRSMQRWMLENRAKFFYITVEHETNMIKNRLVGIDARLQALGVADYISVCNAVDHIATQYGHLAPLAQALGKPLTVFKPENPLTGLFKNMTPETFIVPREFAPSPVEVVG